METHESGTVRVALDGDRILITASAESAPIVAKLPSATRSAKMPPFTWRMPLTCESIDLLRGVGARASRELAEAAKRMMKVRNYVEAQKQAEQVEPLLPIPVKPDIQLYNHQVKMVNIALALMGFTSAGVEHTGGSAALFAQMGTGKTAATVAITGRLYLDGRISRMLIVAPSSVCAVWPNEFRRFADFPHRVVVLLGERDKRLAELKRLQAPTLGDFQDQLRVAVINYESTHRLEAELSAFRPDLIVCDESQRIKGHKALQSKAMHRLGDAAPYKMILTGTPITQDPRDIWSQYRFLAPAIFGGSYYTFEKHYCVFGGYLGKQMFGTRNLDELTRKAHSIAYRVTKSECLDLPEKIFEDRVVELEPDARMLYHKIKKESYAALENGGEVTAAIVLTRLLRLQQLTGGFITDDEGKVLQVSTAKLDATGDIVQSLCVDEGQKLVIFARFRPEIEALRERVDAILRPAELKQVAIWGDVPLTKRGGIVAQFQSDPDTRVLVGQIDACAEGITLTAAHVSVYYSSTWNLSRYLQSQDRTHRIGQDRATQYLHLTVPGTIDTKIMEALARKEDIAKRVVDNWRSLFTGDEGEQ